MPTFMTERIARSLYKAIRSQPDAQLPIPPVTYSREFFAQSDTFTKRADHLLELGIREPVLVVGCGVGLLNEELANRGISSYGIEPGEWCWKQMRRHPPKASPGVEFWPGTTPSSETRIFNDWVGSGNTLRLLAAAHAPTWFAWVIDEDACPAHTNDELDGFISNLEALGETVVHFVTPVEIRLGPGDSSQNWKTLQRWRQLAPRHIWVDAR